MIPPEPVENPPEISSSQKISPLIDDFIGAFDGSHSICSKGRGRSKGCR
jgi:hypothetical protein